MFRFVLIFAITLALGWVLAVEQAAAQCNVRAQSDTASASAAAALQQAQIQQLLALQAAPQAATSAVATAGTFANPLAVQQLALLQAQQRAATASALAAPATLPVQPVCANGSCSSSRVRAAARTVTRPLQLMPRPARSRSVARSVSISRT